VLQAKKERSDDSQSYVESEDEASLLQRKKAKEKELAAAVVTDITSDVGPGQLNKPMASSFAKRCYFTKAGIGKNTQHYEGLTLTGNIVLMLASAMKLKGCPTICDEDLRRVEQTYPNQFSRLPDELLLSSGWRRISKYCHFSSKPIPDGVPFFHSKLRNHPNGGYHFLLAAAVGMIRPIDVEPLSRDTLVLLETDFPTQCDAAPTELIEDPEQWTLVDKFCFFSGGPINTEEDVYYQADFDGNPIYMLAFLSPSLTPEELYKLQGEDGEEIGFTSCREVEEVESVYDLTERDFEDLKLYHLGPCRALPPYILQPEAWHKVLPPHFLEAREDAFVIARQYELTFGVISPTNESNQAIMSPEEMIAMGLDPPLQQPGPKGDVSLNPSHLPVGTDGDVTGYYEEDWDQGPTQIGSGPIPFEGMPTQEAPYPPSQFAPIPQLPPGGVTGPLVRYGYYDPVSPETNEATQPYTGEPPVYTEGPDWYKGGRQPYSRGPPSSYSGVPQSYTSGPQSLTSGSVSQREVEEEGAFVDSSAPIDEQMASKTMKFQEASPSKSGSGAIRLSPPGRRTQSHHVDSYTGSLTGSKMDPPVDEPPSLSLREAPDDESFQESYGPDGSLTRLAYSSPEMQPLQTSEGGYRHQRHPPNDGYYQDGENYYPGEDEYYDSPEALHRAQYPPPPPRNDEYNNGEFPPEKFVREEYVADGFPRYMPGQYGPEDYPPGHGYPPPPQDRQFYVSPDKTESSDPGYSPREGEYYNSPVYTEATGSSQDDFVPVTKTAIHYHDRSPRSEVSGKSGNNLKSSAMRSAKELLKKNRDKRLAAVRPTAPMVIEAIPDDPNSDVVSPRIDEESLGSEIASAVSGSSVWTDTSTGDRSSRRALILQMAKARMKTNKIPSAAHVEDKTNVPIEEEQSFVSGEEQSWEVKGGGTDIDFAGDLD